MTDDRSRGAKQVFATKHASRKALLRITFGHDAPPLHLDDTIRERGQEYGQDGQHVLHLDDRIAVGDLRARRHSPHFLHRHRYPHPEAGLTSGERWRGTPASVSLVPIAGATLER